MKLATLPANFKFQLITSITFCPLHDAVDPEATSVFSYPFQFANINIIGMQAI